jgi:tetratricopeptide (TPR) repeat protein
MKRFSYYTLILILLLACNSQKNILVRNSQFSEDDYYSNFTEATKYALLGNFQNALKLYFWCIKEFPEKAAAYYQISNIYLTANDISKAKYYAKKAVNLDNTNKWYLLNLATIYQYEDNLDSVIVIYEQITKITENVEYKYNLALFYSANKDYKKSMEVVGDLEKEFDGSRELYIIKYRNYAGLNNSDSAVAQLKNLIYFFPDEFENYGMLAEYLSEINRLDDSRKVYKELLKREPDNGLANISFGDYYIKQGEKDSAIVYYKKGFKADDISLEDKMGILYNYMHDPEYFSSDSVFILSLINVLGNKYHDSRSFNLAAEYYITNKKYDKALGELRKSIDLGSDNYVVWEQYIMIANFIERHKDIESIYQQALSKFPDKINIYLFSGYSLFFLKEYTKVIEILQPALTISNIQLDQRVQLFNLLADSYRELTQYNVSDSLYEEILKIDPENLLIRNNYGYYLSVRGINLDRAEELSQFTIKKEPKNPTYLDTYGWILFKLGRSKEALKYIESAIKNGAYNNGEVLDHYGDIMLDLNRCREAIEAWNEAVKYDEELKESILIKINSTKESNCNVE